MKIAIINNRYHVTGGPERYLFALEQRLRERGHEIVPFSIRYQQNRATPYAKYFVPPPGGESAVFYRDVEGFRAKARLFVQGVYSRAARNKLESLIEAERPDLAFVIIVANFLSPSTLLACRDAGVPVVMRLSDFHLVAPCYHFFDGREICERCRTGSRWNAVRKRCLQDSAFVSLGRIFGMAVHDRLHAYDAVDRFVAPSRFLKEKMVASGYDPERIVHIPTFVESPEELPEREAGDYFLYVGRLSPEKGVGRLLEAYGRSKSSLPLLIAGDVGTPEGERLRAVAHEQGVDARFLGRQNTEEVTALVAGARALVVPSLCYENLPRVALEAMAAGRPVVTHDLGSLPEAVKDGETGYLTDPSSPDTLAARLAELAVEPETALRLGAGGWSFARQHFSPDEHVERLTELWATLVSDQRRTPSNKK